MKLNRIQKILSAALLAATAAEPALAAAGTQSVTNFFNTIEGTLQTVSLVVVTISVNVGRFSRAFHGNAFQEVAKPLLGGIMIGSAVGSPPFSWVDFRMRTSPIFKGATRPACVMGIPIKPFVAVCGLGLLPGAFGCGCRSSVGPRSAAHHVADHRQGRPRPSGSYDQLANPSCRAAQQAPLGIGRKPCPDRLQT